MGLNLVLVGDQLQVTGSDLDLTIIATASVSGSRDGTIGLWNAAKGIVGSR